MTNPILVPEIVAKARKLTPALKDRPQWLKPASAARIERIAAAHQVAEQGFKTFAVGVVLAGLELALLRKEAGHGHWGDVLTQYLEPMGITQRHADRYIMVAAATARKHRVDVEALMASPNSVDAEVWAKLTEHVTGSTNATTWRGLIEGMGMARRETRGGYRPDQTLVEVYAQRNKLAGNFEEWTKTQQDAYRTWEREQRRKAREGADAAAKASAAEKRAERTWAPVLQALWMAIDVPKLLLHLSVMKRKELADKCRRVAALIEQSLQ
jgi:hypothetical protein